MHVYLVETEAGPALCKYAYLEQWHLVDRPDRFVAFGGHLARLHAAQYLQARFPSLWPLAHIQVADMIKGRAHFHLLTMRPPRFGPRRKIYARNPQSSETVASQPILLTYAPQ